MDTKNLSELSDEALLEEGKKRKKDNTFLSFAFGITIGITLYSTLKHGIGFFTFFPLFFAPVLYKINGEHQAVKKEIESRKLN